MAASAQTALVKITPRDGEVLGLLRLGYSNKQIGEELKMSDRTVKQHIRLMCLRAGIAGQRVRIRLLNLLDGGAIDEAKLSKLPRRDQEVVRLVCEGKTNAAIAQTLQFSGEQVVKNELKRITEQAGAFSRSELRYMFTGN